MRILIPAAFAAAAIAAASVTLATAPVAQPAAAAAPAAVQLAPAQASGLRATVQAFYAAASDTVRDAFVFDVCMPHGGGARAEWLGPRGRRAYDKLTVKLNAAYLVDPRDSAVEQVQRDFCRAVHGMR